MVTLNEKEVREFWARCLLSIEKKINRQTFETWFRPTKLKYLDEANAQIEVPSSFFADWLEEHYIELIRSTIHDQTSYSPEISFHIAEDGDPNPQDFQRSQGKERPKEEKPLSTTQTNFNPRYTFESFVVGKSNQFAHAASLAVAESPGATSFNPLMIYAGVGLGKTHILHAIAQHCLKKENTQKVIYVSSEKFTNDFIHSIQNNDTARFNQIYRSSDLLLVDDIHFFMNKESTQEAFFHTFNTLYQNGKQIVLTSDRPPSELRGLEERLVSRFQWGLVTDIQPPDYETRVAILKKKAELDNVELPNAIASFIAENITSNIRELEGALIRLLAYCSITGVDLSLEVASEVLKDVIKESKKVISIELIQTEVCKYYGIPKDLIIGKTRRKEIVGVRQVAMYLAKVHTNSSLKTIGLHFGGRDHSTVIHSCQMVEEKLKSDSKFKKEMTEISKRIKSTDFLY